jgi:c-di-GMP-binding flagellar brake protein YcgR
MKNNGVDRRKHKRFKLRDTIFVLIRTGSQNGMGRIIDISESGLACHCLARNGVPFDQPELEVVLAEDSYHLVELPSRTVSDLATDQKLPFDLKKRRCGLQFVRLNAVQRSKLQHFIEENAV